MSIESMLDAQIQNACPDSAGNITNIIVEVNWDIDGSMEVSAYGLAEIAPLTTILFGNQSSITVNGTTYQLAGKSITNLTADVMQVSVNEDSQLILLYAEEVAVDLTGLW